MQRLGRSSQHISKMNSTIRQLEPNAIVQFWLRACTRSWHRRFRMNSVIFLSLVVASCCMPNVSAQPFGYSWGSGGLGQLGNGTTGQSPTPVQINSVSGGFTAVLVAAGASHSLGIANNGTAWAWGDDSNGQLGNGAAGS